MRSPQPQSAIRHLDAVWGSRAVGAMFPISTTVAAGEPPGYRLRVMGSSSDLATFHPKTPKKPMEHMPFFHFFTKTAISPHWRNRPSAAPRTGSLPRSFGNFSFLRQFTQSQSSTRSNEGY